MSFELCLQPVDSTSRGNVGKLIVLLYVPDTDYKLCALKKSYPQLALESCIAKPPIDGKKEGDWYRVDDEDGAEKIINCVPGVVYNLILVPN